MRISQLPIRALDLIINLTQRSKSWKTLTKSRFRLRITDTDSQISVNDSN